MMPAPVHYFTARTVRYTKEELCANITRVLMQFGVRPYKITPTADFYRTLGLSVFDKNIMLLSLEHRFEVAIPEEVEKYLTNMESVAQYIVEAQNN
jgi:acyl carrier protein